MKYALFPSRLDKDPYCRKFGGAARVQEMAEEKVITISKPIKPFDGLTISLDFGTVYWACPSPTDEHTGIDFCNQSGAPWGTGIYEAGALAPTKAKIYSAKQGAYGGQVMGVVLDPAFPENVYWRFFHGGQVVTEKGRIVQPGELLMVGTTRKYAHIHFELLVFRKGSPYWAWAVNPWAFADMSWEPFQAFRKKVSK